MPPERQRCFTRRALAIGMIAGAFAVQARADAGFGLSAGSSAEEYTYPQGSKSVTASRVTVSPWWANEQWRLSVDIPFIDREMSASGAVPVCTWWSIRLQRCLGTALSTASFSERDTGLGDAWLHATRTWHVADHVDTHVGGHARLPTGSSDPSPGTATLSVRSTSRSSGFNDYSLGKDGGDLRLAPGFTVYNELLWGTVEPAYIWTTSEGEKGRPAAYVGVGITPWKYVEASLAFDYEGEAMTGGGTLEQLSYALTLHPVESLSITASTYDDDDPSSPDSNWSIGVTANW